MTRPITAGAGWAAAALAGMVVATPVRAQDSGDRHVYSFSEGAVCRDKNGGFRRDKDGKKTPPPVPPQSGIAAEMTPFGMIKLKLKPDDPDCYLYMFEVGLDPNGTPGSTSCPQVALGQEKSSFTGTRGSGLHCSK
jgi:hypothetical protein